MSIRCALGAISLLLVTSCVDSCGCQDAKEQGSTTKGAPSGAAGASAARPADPKRAAPSAAPSGPRFQPMPESPLRKELVAAGARVDVRGTLGAPAAPAKLGASLASKLGTFAGSAEASLATREVRDLRVPVAVREYVSGTRKLRVKITDTTDLPAVRQEIVDQLTLVGDVTTGNQRGVIVRGAPAVHAYDERPQVSRASVLVGQRYLVEVMVHGTRDPEHALRVVETMNLASLGGSSKKR